jgi:hypothetical protein
MRWPLYPIEALFCVFLIALVWISMRRRTLGWEQMPIILPWVFAKLLYAVWLCVLALQAGGDIAPNATIALWANVLLVGGPASISALLLVRLWKRG